jgi:hypothetical protein
MLALPSLLAIVSGRPSDRAVNPHDSPGDTSPAAR